MEIVLASNSYITNQGIYRIIYNIGFSYPITESIGINDLIFEKKENTTIFLDFDDYINLKSEYKEKYKHIYFCVIKSEEQSGSLCVESIDVLDSEEIILKKIQSLFLQPQKASPSKSEISEREIDVLKCVASGMLNKEIADRLYISINTVISHRKSITEKLGIKSVAGLTVYAIMNQLIKPEEIL